MTPTKRRRGKGLGLGLVPPELRLAVVFAAGVLFIFINTRPAALLLLLVGLSLFLANDTRDWKLAASAPLSAGLMLFYNTILSPASAGGDRWWIFTVNAAGFERGLVTGLRLAGVMLLSFAWLGSTPLPEIYRSLAWFKPGETWTLGILRGVQIIKREVVALTQSLLIRGLRWDSLIANIRNLVPLGDERVPAQPTDEERLRQRHHLALDDLHAAQNAKRPGLARLEPGEAPVDLGQRSGTQPRK